MTGALPQIDLDTDTDLWERQSQETVHRYTQFCTYRDLGRGRTLRQVAETLARNHRYVRDISAAYRWVQRCEAYDRHRDQLHERVWLDERRKAAENDAKVLSAALGKVVEKLPTLRIDELSAGDLIRLLDVVMRSRRSLFGDPAATIAVTGPDGGPMDVRLSVLAGMTVEERNKQILQLTADVQRRAQAAQVRSDEDDDGPQPS